jgi:hypothetical protein
VSWNVRIWLLKKLLTVMECECSRPWPLSLDSRTQCKKFTPHASEIHFNMSSHVRIRFFKWYVRIVREAEGIKYGSLDVSQPYRLPRPVTGTAFPFDWTGVLVSTNMGNLEPVGHRGYATSCTNLATILVQCLGDKKKKVAGRSVVATCRP